jgi:hypothetical protein
LRQSRGAGVIREATLCTELTAESMLTVSIFCADS